MPTYENATPAEARRAAKVDAWRIDAARTRIEMCERFGMPVDPADKKIVAGADTV